MEKRFSTKVGFALSFHFVCILKRNCKASFALCLHFVCSLKRNCKGSFSLSFHFVCSFHSLFTFFSLLMQSAKMSFSLLSNCKQSANKVQREALQFLFKLQTKCKQSAKLALQFLFKMQRKWKESEKAICFQATFLWEKWQTNRKKNEISANMNKKNEIQQSVQSSFIKTSANWTVSTKENFEMTFHQCSSTMSAKTFL